LLGNNNMFIAWFWVIMSRFTLFENLTISTLFNWYQQWTHCYLTEGCYGMMIVAMEITPMCCYQCYCCHGNYDNLLNDQFVAIMW